MAASEALQSFLARSTLQIVILVALPLALLIRFLLVRPSFPPKAPQTLSNDYPIIGAVAFFTKRWDFFRHAISQSPTGNFSFHLGKHPLIGVSGDEGRRVFFESKQLSFAEGYAVLFGQGPDNPVQDEEADSFNKYFSTRITSMLKRENFVRGLPLLIADTKARLEEVATSPNGVMDPFDNIYKIVYQLTMRTVGCNDIADDPALLLKTLRLYEAIEESATPTGIIFPWLPTVAKLKRTIAGGRLYMIFQRIVSQRRKTGKRDEDALQFMIDHGDDVTKIIAFVIGALFAGQINSGINAAWILAYLARDSEWMTKARKEVAAVARKHNPNLNAPLIDQLSNVPVDAWENEFEVLDMCLKDSIRLQLLGTGFRRNISGRDIQLGKEVIPNGAFVAYHLGDTHMNPEIFPNPEQWDPARYFPDRAEDKKKTYGFVGWGAGRHPCLGMRFAKLEMNVIIAHFLAMFDYNLCDHKGEMVHELPRVDQNAHSASKPSESVYFKVRRREK